MSAESFYETHKLVYSLGLPFKMIDVYIDNFMIYWRDNEKLEATIQTARTWKNRGTVPKDVVPTSYKHVKNIISI